MPDRTDAILFHPLAGAGTLIARDRLPLDGRRALLLQTPMLASCGALLSETRSGPDGEGPFPL
jgi:hypothetical protein